MANRVFTQQEYDTLLTPIQVAGQNVQLVIHPLINSLKSYWTFPDDPRQVTVDLGLITKDPCLWKHLPETLPAYSRAVSYMDAGDDANIRIKIVDLKDYKLIPLCVPRVTKILDGNHVPLSITNANGVGLFDFIQTYSRAFKNSDDPHVAFAGVLPPPPGSVIISVHGDS